MPEMSGDTVPLMSKTPPQGFSTYLRRAMGRAGINSASELAHLSGVNQSLVSRWLRDEAQPGVPQLRRIAPHLQVPVLELMVAAGHLEEEEAGLPDPPVARFQVGPDAELYTVPGFGDLSPEDQAAFLRQVAALAEQHRNRNAH